MKNLNSYTLGDDYVSPDKRLSQMLIQQGSSYRPSYSWQETAGRIAQQLLGNYIADEDQGNQNKAFDAMTGLEPDSYSLQPTINDQQIMESPAVQKILQKPNDAERMQNPNIQNNIKAIGYEQDRISEAEAMNQGINDKLGSFNSPADAQREIDFNNQSIAQANQNIDSYGDKFNRNMAFIRGGELTDDQRADRVRDQLIGQRNASMENTLNQKMNPRDYSMQQLRGLENNPYAKRILAQMMMQNADRDYAAGLAKTQRGYDQEDATLKHTRGIETKQLPFTDEQMEQQKKIYDYKQKPRTVTTAEGVFIQNPDGSLGDRIGSPHSQFFDPQQYRKKEQIKSEIKSDAYSNKPLPAATLKMQQEHIDAIGTAQGLDADLGKWEEMITDEKLDLGLFGNLWNKGKLATGWMSDEQSRNFGSFKTSLEKMRNESLRLNKGIQTEGDSQRIWNELIANITDEEFVKQRLQELQAINKRAVELRKYQIETIRNEYGKGPLEEAPKPTAIAGSGSGKTDFVYIPGQGLVPEKRGQ